MTRVHDDLCGSLILPTETSANQLIVLHPTGTHMTAAKTLTVRQLAARHSVSIATVHRWIKSGRLNSLKIGRLRRITLDQEQAFLQQMTRPSPI